MSGGTTRSEIFNKLRQLQNNGSGICIVATCVRFDTKTQTIRVKFSNGLEMDGVRLKAAVNENKDFYWIQVPKPGTSVLLVQIGDKAEAGEYYCLAADEMNALQVKTDETEFKVNIDGIIMKREDTLIELLKNGKIKIEKGDDNLGYLLDNLLFELAGADLSIAGTAGPYPVIITVAGLGPSIKSKLTQFRTDFAKILEA